MKFKFKSLQKSETAPEDRIPIHEKLAFGTSETMNILPGQLAMNLSPQIFNMSLGISPTLVTLVLAIFRLIDAFTDPLVGWLSDRFRSRWGRRRPFMLAGVIGMALTLPVVFQFNHEWSHLQIMGWFLFWGSVLYFFNTLFNIPYQSLGMEMTADYNERTSLNGYRAVMVKILSIGAGWIWYLTQLPFFQKDGSGTPDTLSGAQSAAFVVAGILLIVGFFPVKFCKERYYQTAVKEGAPSFWPSLRITLKNQPFRMLLLMLLAMQLPYITHPMGAYLNTYYFFDGEQKAASIITGWNWTLAQIVAFMAIPVVAFFARRIGKELLLKIIVLANILVSISHYLVYSQDNPWLVLIPGVLFSPLITGLWMLLPSMSADVVDYDEFQTGKRREGQYAAVYSWLFKFSATLTVALSGPILDMIGFDALRMGNQSDSVFFKMKILLVTPPIIAVIIQFWILQHYPLNQEIMRDVRAKLEARRGKIT